MMLGCLSWLKKSNRMKGEHEGSEEIELKEERVNRVLRTFFSLIYYLV